MQSSQTQAMEHTPSASLPIQILRGISFAGNTLAILMMPRTIGQMQRNLEIVLGVSRTDAGQPAR